MLVILKKTKHERKRFEEFDKAISTDELMDFGKDKSVPCLVTKQKLNERIKLILM